MYFCKDNGELFMLEVMMRQAPGFRARKSGMHVTCQDLTMSDVFGQEGKEEMKLRMERYEVPGRIRDEVTEREAEDGLFRDEAHRQRFLKVLCGPCKKQMQVNGRFLAAVFLLCSDEWLWNRVKDQVTDVGILFDNASIHGAGPEQYVTFHAAKEIYTGVQFISMEEMADSETVSDDLLSLIVSAYLLRVAGIGLAGDGKKNG